MPKHNIDISYGQDPDPKKHCIHICNVLFKSLVMKQSLILLSCLLTLLVSSSCNIAQRSDRNFNRQTARNASLNGNGRNTTQGAYRGNKHLAFLLSDAQSCDNSQASQQQAQDDQNRKDYEITPDNGNGSQKDYEQWAPVSGERGAYIELLEVWDGFTINQQENGRIINANSRQIALSNNGRPNTVSRPRRSVQNVNFDTNNRLNASNIAVNPFYLWLSTSRGMVNYPIIFQGGRGNSSLDYSYAYSNINQSQQAIGLLSTGIIQHEGEDYIKEYTLGVPVKQPNMAQMILRELDPSTGNVIRTPIVRDYNFGQENPFAKITSVEIYNNIAAFGVSSSSGNGPNQADYTALCILDIMDNSTRETTINSVASFNRAPHGCTVLNRIGELQAPIAHWFDKDSNLGWISVSEIYGVEIKPHIFKLIPQIIEATGSNNQADYQAQLQNINTTMQPITLRSQSMGRSGLSGQQQTQAVNRLDKNNWFMDVGQGSDRTIIGLKKSANTGELVSYSLDNVAAMQFGSRESVVTLDKKPTDMAIDPGTQRLDGSFDRSNNSFMIVTMQSNSNSVRVLPLFNGLPNTLTQRSLVGNNFCTPYKVAIKPMIDSDSDSYNIQEVANQEEEIMAVEEEPKEEE